MVYKIIWKSGGETAERYATKAIAKRILSNVKNSGTVVKTKLGSAGRTSPFTEHTYGGKSKAYPSGVRLKWVKSPTGVYTTRRAR